MQRLLLRAVGLLVRAYYRPVSAGGSVPAEGAVLLVANHPNGLVDPVVLSWTTERPLRFLGKAPLFDMPVIGLVLKGMRALPVYRSQDGADTRDNERTFAAVHTALAAGDVVCLFPEGKSHNEPTLQRLKTGAARMALGAEEAAGWSLGVRVVPVGLVYRAKRRFRSSVATWVGEPIAVGDSFSAEPDDTWRRVEALNERIAAGLQSVNLELDRWEDLPLLELAERIERKDERSDEGERLARLHAFAAGLRVLRREAPERMTALAERVGDFRRRLRTLGIDLADIDRRYHPLGVTRFVLKNLFWLLLGFPLALLGFVVFALPYWAARFVGGRMHPSRDIYATVQILAGTTFFTAAALLVAALAGWAWGWPSGLLVLGLLVPAGLAALAFHDWQRSVLADVGAFFRLGGQARLRASLTAERDALAATLADLRRDFEARSEAGTASPARAPTDDARVG